MTTKNSKKTWTIVGLLVAIGLCASQLPWGEWGGVPFAKVARERLDARLQHYQEFRKADDWVALYEMTDPGHRKLVDRMTFLKMYGSGIVKIHGFDTKSVTIDTEKHTAVVVTMTDGEMIPAKLPAEFRRNLRIDDPKELRRAAELTLNWRWVDDQWYFQMDREILTGRDPNGQEIAPVAAPKTASVLPAGAEPLTGAAPGSGKHPR
jgi:hypothetical protein